MKKPYCIGIASAREDGTRTFCDRLVKELKGLKIKVFQMNDYSYHYIQDLENNINNSLKSEFDVIIIEGSCVLCDSYVEFLGTKRKGISELLNLKLFVDFSVAENKWRNHEIFVGTVTEEREHSKFLADIIINGYGCKESIILLSMLKEYIYSKIGT